MKREDDSRHKVIRDERSDLRFVTMKDMSYTPWTKTYVTQYSKNLNGFSKFFHSWTQR